MDLSRPANDLLDLVALVVKSAAGRQDLSLTSVATLSSIDRQGPQRITTLAAAQAVSQPSMTQLVQRLEHRGLVARGSDPADGRAALVSVTDRGRAALTARRQRNAEHIARLLADLPESDVQALADALAAVLPRVRASLGAEASGQRRGGDRA